MSCLRKTLMTAWVVGLLAAGLAQAEILKFKMTDKSLPLPPGFQRVTADTEYTKDLGYGWTRGNRVEWRKLDFGMSYGLVVITGTFPDIVTGSWVAPGRCVWNRSGGEAFDFQDEAEFRVDAPAGKYVAYAILGDYYYTYGRVANLAKPFSVAVNGKTLVDVKRTEKEIADIYYSNEYKDYDPRISYWRRYVKEHYDRTTYRLPVESDGSLRFTFRGIPVTMIAIWPEAEEAAARTWVAELERVREGSCQLKEFPRPPVKPFAASADQAKQGYLLFTADIMENVYPDTVPDAAALDSEVALFAAKGQRESATFGLYPLKQLEDVQVKVGALKNEAGQLFPPEKIDVRFVKYLEMYGSYSNVGWDYSADIANRSSLGYVVSPMALVAWKKINVYEGVTRQCWLRFDVPADLPTGTYTGEVTVAPANAPAATKKLRLRVLPFRLRTLTEDDRYIDLTISYIYPRHPNIWPGTDEKEMSRKIMKAWADYGFNLGPCGFGFVDAKQVDGKVQVDLSQVGEWLKGWSDAGVTLKGVVFTDALNYLTCRLAGAPGPVRFFGASLEECKKAFPQGYDDLFVSLAQGIDKEFARRGWPTVIFFEGGEGGGHESGRYYETRVHTLCHQAGVKNSLALSGDINYFKEITPLVWAPYDYYFNQEKFEWLKDHKANIFYMATFNRFERGLYFWRINAKGHHAETFCLPGLGDPYNPFTGTEWAGGIVLPSRDNDGVNPMLVAERHVREGHDDARYLFQLDWLIGEALKTGEPEVVASAEQARSTLGQISDTINPDLQYYRRSGGYPSNSVYPKLRWRVAREIMKLQDVLKANGCSVE